LSVLRALAVTFAAVGLLAACAQPVPSKRYDPISFAHKPAIELDVAQVTIVNDFHPPAGLPHVEGEMPVSPEQALEQWATDRLSAQGTAGEARFIIKNASVVESHLKTTQGIQGFFTKDQSEKYDGQIEVRLEVYSPGRNSDGFVVTKASRTITVPEDISVSGLRDSWYKLVQEMMLDFDAETEATIRARLRPFLF
jgi:hypothetical protein